MSAKYQARRRSLALAYVAWFLFGIFGAHRFYLKRTNSASVMLALAVGPYVALFIVGLIEGLLSMPDGDMAAIGAITILCHIVLAFWVVIDAFLIPGLVERYNLNVAEEVEWKILA